MSVLDCVVVFFCCIQTLSQHKFILTHFFSCEQRRPVNRNLSPLPANVFFSDWKLLKPKVEFTKKKINAAAWVIKKSLNLHARLQGRSRTRRDPEVQEITDLWLQL